MNKEIEEKMYSEIRETLFRLKWGYWTMVKVMESIEKECCDFKPEPSSEDVGKYKTDVDKFKPGETSPEYDKAMKKMVYADVLNKMSCWNGVVVNHIKRQAKELKQFYLKRMDLAEDFEQQCLEHIGEWSKDSDYYSPENGLNDGFYDWMLSCLEPELTDEGDENTDWNAKIKEWENNDWIADNLSVFSKAIDNLEKETKETIERNAETYK